MGEALTLDALTEHDLKSGFASFVEAAKRLEESYAALRQRAAEVDVQLAEANARLEATLDEREAVFRAMPVGVIRVSRDGVERFRNAEAERIGAATAAFAFDPLVAPEGLHELGEFAIRVDRVTMPDGGSLIVAEDRSRVAHLEREVDRLDRLAGLSELALGVAHEIKNPLNGVMGFAQLMERQDDPERIKRYAGKIATGMQDVDSIVKAMLAFARPSDRRDVPVPVGGCIDRAIRESGWTASRVSVAGDRDVPVDGPTLVRALANLFRNSREAGAAACDVTVEVVDGAVRIDVVDDGPGVPASVGERAFDPFVSSKERGHGLGLALVARVLSFLGGAIELCNPGSAGAHFRIRIPTLGAERG